MKNLNHLRLFTASALALLSLPATLAGELGREAAEKALRRAGEFYRSLATEGGYLWRYSQDLSERAGERPATPTQIWVQPPGTPSVGMAFLRAYEVTSDARYLDAAKAAADALARGQLESGGWDYLIDFDPDASQRWYRRTDQGKLAEGDAAKRRNTSTFDDDNSQSALRFLMAVVKANPVAPDERGVRIREALDYGLKRMLDAQYPNGAWPQRYDGKSRDGQSVAIRRARYPDDWPRTFPNADYRSFYTFNDDTHRDCILTMLEAHRQFGSEPYLASAKKGGEFILLAQLPEPQPAWAQQYNERMEPAWARRFEPPAVSGGESSGVIRTLLDLYLETGEERFLSPIPAAIQWYQRSAIGPNTWARFYELRTNRPLYFTKEYKLVYTDDDLPTHYSFKSTYGVPETIRYYEEVKRLGRTEYNRQHASESPSRSASRKRLEAMESNVQRIIQAMDDQGRWVTNGQIESRVFIQNMRAISDYLELAR